MEVVLDDRLLIEEPLVGLHRRGAGLHTTAYWYYRACRAAVAGASGHLSGPFRDLPLAEQQRAVTSMLQLPAEIGLPRPDVVPIMVSVAGRQVNASAFRRSLRHAGFVRPSGSHPGSIGNVARCPRCGRADPGDDRAQLNQLPIEQ